MWKLIRLTARNVCAFRELDYYPVQGVTTLVFGDNRDNESQRSNGSGKSALLECVAVGITGNPLRKVKNDEIINDTADTCYVSLEFSNTACNELFIIERDIHRKGASRIYCTIRRDGQTVETDEAVQSSVDNYNKYILEKLGITREELFNNFILSKHRYEDFLSASDKVKKEIINRFSNGIVVDEAIEKVQEDITPVEQELKEADLKLAGLDGRIDMLSEQIRNEENSKEERVKSKTEKIAVLQHNISEKRKAIREMKLQTEAKAGIGVRLDEIDKEIQGFENSEESLENCLRGIKPLLCSFGELTDWESVVSVKREEIARIREELPELDDGIERAGNLVRQHTAAAEKLKSEHRQFVESSTRKSEDYKAELKRLEKQLAEVSTRDGELRSKRRTLTTAIEALSNKIAGTIICPECKHEFLASDKTFDVKQGHGELKQKKDDLSKVVSRISEMGNRIAGIEQSQAEIQDGRRELNKQHAQWLGKVDVAEKEMQSAVYELEGLQRKQKQITVRISSVQDSIEGVRRKLFDEAYEIIDSAVRLNRREIKALNEDIVAAGSSIETLYVTIGELNSSSPSEITDSLRASLKTYRKQSATVLASKTGIEQKLGCLREQEQRFAQFKSYLANTKIEALSKITNEFLESIGSDIRIRFSGYTVLKTGKVREKISVSLIRDGVDCGSFGKFSEGEKARVNLASILAMQKLVNSNCEDDKGLDLLILDEILSAVDEEGNAKMFEALNKLGITVLVVSHGHVSESYPYTLIIRKENGESGIV